MGFKCGIVGLPNVGKSTLFNALSGTAEAAEAANYPFCTIEPNTGRVPVPDPRLPKIAKLAGTSVEIPTFMEFVDIAGLVKGASKGEGLGNKFLANIRETDAIAHVLRCFEDDDITHVDGAVDPVRDAETIETELMLADLESIEKRIPALDKKIRGNDKDAKALLPLLQKCQDALEGGKPIRFLDFDADDALLVRQQQFLTNKPVLYVCNVNEGDAKDGNTHTQNVAKLAADQNAQHVLITAAIEAEVAQIDDEADRKEFLADLGLDEPGLNRLIRTGYDMLGLQTYFTAGVKEARAWTIQKGFTAPQGAGVIHTDFEKGFICAETIAYDDYIVHAGEQGAKDAGKWRQEGKDYVINDGDVIHFRFNV